MGEIDAAGDIVTGGLIGRAVEPGHGEASGPHDGLCLNCGTALLGDYCHRCGQAGHIHRSLAAIWHDIAHGVLHFEGKIWRTLPLLFFRPGQLTCRFIAGERARFVSPMALFLFSVFLMYAVFSAVGGPVALHGPEASPETAKQVEAEKIRVEAKLAGLEAERERRLAARQPTSPVDDAIGDLRSELTVLSAAQAFRSDAGDKVDLGKEVDKLNVDTGSPGLDSAVRKAAENPSLLAYKMQTNAYKFSWALIPISVPFVWLLLFWKRRYKVYDHAVFVTYSLAFMTLGLVALSLLGIVGLSPAAAVLAIIFVPPAHIYAQLRGAYALSRFGALWRTCFLLVFAAIAATFFGLLLLALGGVG